MSCPCRTIPLRIFVRSLTRLPISTNVAASWLAPSLPLRSTRALSLQLSRLPSRGLHHSAIQYESSQEAVAKSGEDATEENTGWEVESRAPRRATAETAGASEHSNPAPNSAGRKRRRPSSKPEKAEPRKRGRSPKSLVGGASLPKAKAKRDYMKKPAQWTKPGQWTKAGLRTKTGLWTKPGHRTKPGQRMKPGQGLIALGQKLSPADDDTPPTKEDWQIQKKALAEKFPEGWNPRKRLSPDALEGIRALNQQFPDVYTTEVLANKFEVSAEAIRRILKSKWKPTVEEEEDRQQRWFNRGKQIWTRWAELGKKPPQKWRDEGIGSERTPSRPNATEKQRRFVTRTRLSDTFT